MTYLFGSTDLKAIIERHGWSLYDVTRPPSSPEPTSWRELGLLAPAEGYEFGHTYLFMPLPTIEKNHVTAYVDSWQKKDYPALTIPRNSTFTARGTDPYSYRDFQMYFLSELSFRQQDIFAFSHHRVYLYSSPTLSIPYPEALNLFLSCFSIVNTDQQGIKFKLSKQSTLN